MVLIEFISGITHITYSRLNKPETVTFDNGQRQTITYDGFGNKKRTDYSVGLETVIGGDIPADDAYTVSSSRVYVGSHVFADGKLEYSGFPGGYFDPARGAMYYITDWQGNNIAVVDSEGNTAQRTTYYPYGEPTVEPSGQRYLFGGKEREHAAGLNSYDFGARSLTPYGIWPSPDPLAEKFYSLSPYSFCGGDPINYIDPKGKRRNPVKDDSSIRGLHNSNDFGIVRKGTTHPHGGVDINYDGDEGGSVYATHDGIVTRLVREEDDNKGGIRLKITSSDNRVATFYMHFKAISKDIKLGDYISEGQEIGIIGSTGESTGAHLHYEVFLNGERINPAINRLQLIDPQSLLTIDNKTYPGGQLKEVIVSAHGISPGQIGLQKSLQRDLEQIKKQMETELYHGVDYYEVNIPK